jgi:hypothetical protein
MIGRPIWLITNDRDMLGAAQSAGEPNVKKFEAYRDVLQLSREPFDAQL